MTSNEAKRTDQAVLSLASKYAHREKHSQFVEKAAMQLFDSLKGIHKLGHAEKILLSHAALLHDIGSFITETKHHKHTKYIIDKDESLFEYPERERNLLSLIAYNHRKRLHKNTLRLPKADRDKVLKLSALLRVADSLYYNGDEISIKNVSMVDCGVHIAIEGVLPERLSGRLLAKKDLFVDIFKMDISLHM